VIEIEKALEQVREMRHRVIESGQFHGWSGRVRVSTGVVTAAVGFVLWKEWIPKDEVKYLYVWLGLLVFSVVINLGAMTNWFLRDPKVNRRYSVLRPLLDGIPALGCGALLTAVLVAEEKWSLLVGVWALHYGLTNFALRRVLPKATAYVALFYMVSGAVYVIIAPSFLNPIPMTVTFMVGELAGGLVLHFDRNRRILPTEETQ
jgi:hypothetical protein